MIFSLFKNIYTIKKNIILFSDYQKFLLLIKCRDIEVLTFSQAAPASSCTNQSSLKLFPWLWKTHGPHKLACKKSKAESEGEDTRNHSQTDIQVVYPRPYKSCDSSFYLVFACVTCQTKTFFLLCSLILYLKLQAK